MDFTQLNTHHTKPKKHLNLSRPNRFFRNKTTLVYRDPSLWKAMDEAKNILSVDVLWEWRYWMGVILVGNPTSNELISNSGL